MQTPISIHALHEESDTTANVMLRMLKFQSTLSMRRATLRGHVDRVVQPISIHALHEESDLGYVVHGLTVTYFNPRSP